MVDFYGVGYSQSFEVRGPAYQADALLVPPKATGFEQCCVFIPEEWPHFEPDLGRVTVEGRLKYYEHGGGEVTALAVFDRLQSRRGRGKGPRRLARILLDTTYEYTDYDPAS